MIPYTRDGEFVSRKALINDTDRKLELPKSNNRAI